MTFAVDTHGNFHPMDTNYHPAPRPKPGHTTGPWISTEPGRIFKKLFTSGSAPARGGTTLSKEEGLIIKLAKRKHAAGSSAMLRTN